MNVISFTERVQRVHDAFTSAGVPFAIGGALALAYHVDEPRATNDIDVNVMLNNHVTSLAFVAQALEGIVTFSDAQREAALRDGQVRTYWDSFAIDIFFSIHHFHDDLTDKVQRVPFAGRTIPIISSSHLAVLKALFNRPKDWVDIQEMAYVETFQRARVMVWLRDILSDPNDDRPQRIADLNYVRERDQTAKNLFPPRGSN
jgi:hypothetical protein